MVGSDGSTGSRRALSWAARRAVDYGRELVVLRVYAEMPIPTRTGVHVAMVHGTDWLTHYWAGQRAEVDEDVALARAQQPALRVTGGVQEAHSPAQFLAEVAADSFLLVLGATGASAVDRTLLGGTVGAVLGHARGPVAVVPEHAGDTAGPVVVGLDEAPQSVAVAERAFVEAGATTGHLVAAHAWETPGLDLPDAEEDEISESYRRLLTDYTASATGADVRVEYHVRRGRPADVLVELSRGASTLVTGSRVADVLWSAT